MDKDRQALLDLIEEKYNKSYDVLCKKLGKEVVDELHERLEEALAIAMEEQYSNFAEVRRL
ncbi:hypothetical protein ACIQ1D_19215 [Lysinibacillus xylanilyticus]|uniref:hypothetical protein n=1 Tax=Lysinibacillus xylanilyticus TaxID=582475 RepID=UPI0037FEA0D8